jgi:kinetochore protein Nuf2
VSEHELFTPAKESLDHRATFVEYPELHEESLGEIRFLRHCIKLMNICGIADFGIRDLATPTPRRLRRQLSAYVNFVRYREDKLSNVLEELIHYRSTEVLPGYEQVHEEHIYLTERLQMVRRECEEDWRAVEAVENECAELEVEISRMSKTNTVIRNENSQMKKRVNDIVDMIETKSLDLQKLQTVQHKLNAQIVPSPDTIQQEMNDVKMSLEAQKSHTAKVEKELQTSRQTIENLRIAKDNVLKVIATMDDVQDVTFRLHEVESQLHDKQRELNHTEHELHTLKEAVAELEQQIMELQDQLDQNRQEHESNMAVAEEDYCKGQQDMVAVERERREGMAQVNDAEAKVICLESQISTERQLHHTEMEEMMQEYRTFESHVLEQDAKLRAAIGEVQS